MYKVSRKKEITVHCGAVVLLNHIKKDLTELDILWPICQVVSTPRDSEQITAYCENSKQFFGVNQSSDDYFW